MTSNVSSGTSAMSFSPSQAVIFVFAGIPLTGCGARSHSDRSARGHDVAYRAVRKPVP